MLGLDSPETPWPPSLFETKGAFGWWYVDLVDADDRHAVLIVAGALPMAGREAHASRPREHLSLNLAVYERGRLVFYVLEQHGEDTAGWEGDCWRIGASRVRLSRRGSELALVASLDLAQPGGERVRGTLVAVGPAAHGPAMGTSVHGWSPLCGAARGRLDLVGEGRHLVVSGSAYLDRNHAPSALSALGIARWAWGRHAFGDRLFCWYLLWPADSAEAPVQLAVEVAADGSVAAVPCEARLRGPRLSRWGLRFHRRLELETSAGSTTITLGRPLESGPFYLRLPAEAERQGERTSGIAEVLVPGRISRPWVSALVGTCVHRPYGRNSVLLPLFCGLVQSRFARLGRSLVHGQSPVRVLP